MSDRDIGRAMSDAERIVAEQTAAALDREARKAPSPARIVSVDIEQFHSQGVARENALWTVVTTVESDDLGRWRHTSADISWREKSYRLPSEDPMGLYIHVASGQKEVQEAEGIVEAINAALKWRQENHDA